MNPAFARTKEFLDGYSVLAPHVVELAKIVSLAVRVEPKLLRAARLKLTPTLDAGIESDLWFSPLVGSRSTDAIVLERDVLAVLRESLKMLDETQLLAARRVVSRAHAGESPSIQLEEQVIWLTIRGGSNAMKEIEQELRRALKAMVSDRERGVAVARWADRALSAFPVEVLETEAARLLFTGSTVRLGRRARLIHHHTLPTLPETSSWLIPESEGTSAGILFYKGALEFVHADDAALSKEGILLEIPADDLMPIEMSWESDGVVVAKSVIPAVGNVVELPTEVREVEIRTAAGVRYRLSVKSEGLAERPSAKIRRRTKKFLSWDGIKSIVEKMPEAATDLRVAFETLRLENRGAKILVVGNTGAGKTALVNNLLNPSQTVPAGPTRQIAETLAMPVSGGRVVVVDTPGSEQYFHLLGENLDDLAAGAIMGVLNVVAYGYNDSRARKPENDRPRAYLAGEINLAYLERQREDDLRFLDRWLITNTLIHDGIKWIITVVNKYDLWRAEYDRVMEYYSGNGEYGSRIISVLQEGSDRYSVVNACAGESPRRFRMQIPMLPTASEDEIRLRNAEFLSKFAGHLYL